MIDPISVLITLGTFASAAFLIGLGVGFVLLRIERKSS